MQVLRKKKYLKNDIISPLIKIEILRIVQLQIPENREANQEGGGEQDEGKVNENGNIKWFIDAQRT